jgi:hypothetical protein
MNKYSIDNFWTLAVWKSQQKQVYLWLMQIMKIVKKQISTTYPTSETADFEMIFNWSYSRKKAKTYSRNKSTVTYAESNVYFFLLATYYDQDHKKKKVSASLYRIFPPAPNGRASSRTVTV